MMALRGDQGLQIDICLFCGGVYLDSGEITALKQYSAHQRAKPASPPSTVANLSGPPTGTGSSEYWPIEVVLALLELLWFV